MNKLLPAYLKKQQSWYEVRNQWKSYLKQGNDAQRGMAMNSAPGYSNTHICRETVRVTHNYNWREWGHIEHEPKWIAHFSQCCSNLLLTRWPKTYLGWIFLVFLIFEQEMWRWKWFKSRYVFLHHLIHWDIQKMVVITMLLIKKIGTTK